MTINIVWYNTICFLRTNLYLFEHTSSTLLFVHCSMFMYNNWSAQFAHAFIFTLKIKHQRFSIVFSLPDIPYSIIHKIWRVCWNASKIKPTICHYVSPHIYMGETFFLSELSICRTSCPDNHSCSILLLLKWNFIYGKIMMRGSAVQCSAQGP